MTYVKRIVCLANSFKIGGACIAGREILVDGSYGGWIRPVSSRPTAEVSYVESRYQNNTAPKLLDIIDVSMLKPAPHNHQTENHEIDATKRWVKRGEFPWAELSGLSERPSSLWINSDRTGNGIFNCMSDVEAATLNSSLVLLKKRSFTVEVGSKTWAGRTTKTYRGNFKYKDIAYSFSLTDPVATNLFASKNEGEYPFTDVFICLSLTEPWKKDNDRCHKLVASLITNPPL
jgi:hypothetical protein